MTATSTFTMIAGVGGIISLVHFLAQFGRLRSQGKGSAVWLGTVASATASLGLSLILLIGVVPMSEGWKIVGIVVGAALITVAVTLDLMGTRRNLER